MPVRASIRKVSSSGPAQNAGFRVREPVTVVIFGASGDLAKRKLLPALYHLHKSGLLPERFAIVGSGRRPFSNDEYRQSILTELRQIDSNVTTEHPLLKSVFYVAGDVQDLQALQKLRDEIEAIENAHDLPGNRLFYLAVAPELFAPIIKNLRQAELIRPMSAPAWSRVIIEKPFGHDLQSAQRLNAEITAELHESQIFRIDHYLGKETVQNILSFRFGNAIFEPLFNQKYVDHVQITVAETLGMEHGRGAYYDSAGALRDVVQNHMLQLLCLTAMEPPSAMDAQSIRDEKVKILRAVMIPNDDDIARNTVRGQYEGYRREQGVAPDSMTETYVALRLHIDNWRWAGVPFLLRHGKQLKSRASEISIQFKKPPLQLFRQLPNNADFCLLQSQTNQLVFHIQPDEGISLSFACKRPGMKIELEEVDMDFFYSNVFEDRSPEAYERLLLDAMRGDASLFTRSDEVDCAWRIMTAILDGWKKAPPPTFPNYSPGSQGPDASKNLFGICQGSWRPL